MDDYSTGCFNLMISGGCSGADNMAVDSFLLNKYKTRDTFSSRPTLRLYYFSPPALSLGFFQRDKDNISEGAILRARGKHYDIVKRPTGGRAVLHKDEITYSVVSSYKDGVFAGKLLETYRKVGRFLYLFFTSLGLSPDGGHFSSKSKKEDNKIERYKKRKDAGFNCFLKTHSYEITFGGKKICGNSQRRNETAFLQHGSIYVDYHPLDHIYLFENGIFDSGYFNGITGIKQKLDEEGVSFDLSFSSLANILVKSFEGAYDLKPVVVSLSEIDVT